MNSKFLVGLLPLFLFSTVEANVLNWQIWQDGSTTNCSVGIGSFQSGYEEVNVVNAGPNPVNVFGSSDGYCDNDVNNFCQNPLSTGASCTFNIWPSQAPVTICIQNADPSSQPWPFIATGTMNLQWMSTAKK